MESENRYAAGIMHILSYDLKEATQLGTIKLSLKYYSLTKVKVT